jgi:hypothetical protein
LTEVINKPNELELENWIRIRAQANQACFQFLGHVQKQAEVRIWPHHFDTGVYLEFNAQVGIGFGLAIADSMIDKPYYYLVGYPLGSKSWNWQEVIALKTGTWIVTDG